MNEDKREIKFRAWDKIKKEWTLFDTFYELQRWCRTISELLNFEIIQYTGLKDKNGKEIYEGDIIRVIDGEDDSSQEYEHIYQVIFSPPHHGHHGYPSCFVMWEIGCTDISKTRLFSRDWEISREIIGNIYENPDLI